MMLSTEKSKEGICLKTPFIFSDRKSLNEVILAISVKK